MKSKTLSLGIISALFPLVFCMSARAGIITRVGITNNTPYGIVLTEIGQEGMKSNKRGNFKGLALVLLPGWTHEGLFESTSGKSPYSYVDFTINYIDKLVEQPGYSCSAWVMHSSYLDNDFTGVVCDEMAPNPPIWFVGADPRYYLQGGNRKHFTLILK